MPCISFYSFTRPSPPATNDIHLPPKALRMGS
jgi:hypothetical protein